MLFIYLLVGTVILFNLLIAVVTDAYEENVSSKMSHLQYTKMKGSSIIRFLQTPSAQGPPLNLVFLGLQPAFWLLGVTETGRKNINQYVYRVCMGSLMVVGVGFTATTWLLVTSPFLLIAHSLGEAGMQLRFHLESDEFLRACGCRVNENPYAKRTCI